MKRLEDFRKKRIKSCMFNLKPPYRIPTLQQEKEIPTTLDESVGAMYITLFHHMGALREKAIRGEFDHEYMILAKTAGHLIKAAENLALFAPLFSASTVLEGMEMFMRWVIQQAKAEQIDDKIVRSVLETAQTFFDVANEEMSKILEAHIPSQEVTRLHPENILFSLLGGSGRSGAQEDANS